MTNRNQSSSHAPTSTRSDDGRGDFSAESGTLVVEDFSLKHGFVQLPRVVLYARNLSRHAKMLYAVLLGYAWQEHQCFPGYARLCEDLQASENSVRTYMRELEASNLLRQQRRGLGKTNLYILPDLRASKIEVQEPQPIKPSKSEVLVPQDSHGLDPQDSHDIIETDELETEVLETDSNISNIRKVQPAKGRGGQRDQAPTDPAPLSEDERSSTPEAVGEVLERRFARAPRSRPRPETETDDYQRIQALVVDRAREFADSAPLKSSTTRAWNLFRKSGVSISTFESKLYQAKALTLEATARITSSSTDPQHRGRKNKMAYFFATLEDQLNLITPEERARRNPAGAVPKSTIQGQPAVSTTGKDRASTGRKPDSEGPYGAYIKS